MTTTVLLGAEATEVSTSGDRRRPPYRLRDLSRRALLVVAVLVVLLAAPWAASYRRATDAGFTLSGDSALIGLRVRDVFNGNPPLRGQPSTANKYSDKNGPSHPGPVEFYLLTIPTFAFGADSGALVGAAVFTFAGVLAAVWAIFRRAGPWVGLAGAVIMSAIAFAQGPMVLTDIISSNVGGIPLLGLTALAWAIFDGDIRLLPLAAFFVGFVAQAHLAILAIGLGVGMWAVVGVVRYVIVWRWHRAEGDVSTPHWTRWRWSERLARGVDSPEPPRDRPRPWIIGALVVTVLTWFPVIVDVVTNRGGNVGLILGFSGDDRATLGLGRAVRMVLRAVGLPPLLVRTNLGGGDIWAPLGALTIVASILVLGALVFIVAWAWRRRPPLATLALTTLVLAALGVVNGSQVPLSYEADRINFYRWTFALAAFTWLCIGWAVWVAVAARRPAVARARRVPFAYAAVGCIAVISLLACTVSGPRHIRDQELFGLERQATAAVLPAVEGQERILLIPSGAASNVATAPALALALEKAGHKVFVPRIQAPGYGEHRVIGDKDYDAAVLYRSSPPGRMKSVRGKRVFSHDLNAKRRARVAALAAEAKGQPFVVAPDGEAVIQRLYPRNGLQRLMSAGALKRIMTDPERVLADPAMVRLIMAGYLTSPKFDRKTLEAVDHLPAPRASWGDELFDIRVLNPEEVRETFPKLR